MCVKDYEALIKDAEWRVGNYIVCGGCKDDLYVKLYIANIVKWSNMIYKLLQEEAIFNEQTTTKNYEGI